MATFGMVTEVAEGDRRERIADRVFATAGMVGAVGGAFAGVALDSALNIGYPTTIGGFGTMLGSVIALAVGVTFVLPKLVGRVGK
jgi:hypothetical protein